MMDVLLYTVVLNLFDEYVDSIVIESFTVSLIAAVVMKGLIDAIQYGMESVQGHFREREGSGARVLMVVLLWAILFLSKFAILWIVDIIFEDDVDLGGFLQVLILVLVMMVTRRVSLFVFERLGGSNRNAPEKADALESS